MDIEKDSNREAFEAWFESRYDAHFMQFALDFDMYADKHTQTCWEAWQAAKAQAVPEGFVLVPDMPSDEFIDKLADVICNEFDTTISGSAHCAREAYKAMMEQSK